jgi:hypothetical protein
MEEHQYASDSAPVIGFETENPSGERGTGQAETARVVFALVPFRSPSHSWDKLYSIIRPTEEMSLK